MFFKNVNFINFPKTKEKVLWACDPIYFENFGYYNLLSCNEVGHDVHIHLINPPEDLLDRILKINLSIDLSISYEHFDVNLNVYKLKSYYFCSRFFIAQQLFLNTLVEKLFITDADIIFNQKIIFPDNKFLGLGYFPDNNNLWKQSSAGLIIIAKQKKEFLDLVLNEYNKRLLQTNFDLISESMDKITKANLYGLDQVCMSYVLQTSDIIDDTFFNLEDEGYSMSNKNLNLQIWALTGWPKQNLEEFKQIMFRRFGQIF